MHHSGEGRYRRRQLVFGRTSAPSLRTSNCSPTAANAGDSGKGTGPGGDRSISGRDRRARCYPGDRRRAAGAAGPQKKVSEGPGQKPRRDVGPGDGDSRQRRNRTLRTLRSGVDRQRSATFESCGKTETGAGTPGPGRIPLIRKHGTARRGRCVARRAHDTAKLDPRLEFCIHRRVRSAGSKEPAPLSSQSASHGAPVEYLLLPDHRLLLLRIDELCRPGAQRGRESRNTRRTTKSTVRCRFPCPNFSSW